MEEEARKRRERLRARFATQGSDEAEDGGDKGEVKRQKTEDAQDEGQPIATPKFRNYVPHTKALQEAVIPVPDIETAEQIAAPLAQVDESLLPNKQEVDLNNLAPMKPNWDLKRDVQKRMKKLEKRTSNAIADILRERIARQDGGVDLVAAAQAREAA